MATNPMMGRTAALASDVAVAPTVAAMNAIAGYLSRTTGAFRRRTMRSRSAYQATSKPVIAASSVSAVALAGDNETNTKTRIIVAFMIARSGDRSAATTVMRAGCAV